MKVRCARTLPARLGSLALAALTVALGLTWRLAPLGLPAFPLKYGGSVLWGAMVFFLVAAGRPVWLTRGGAVAVAIVIAAGVEALRLYHAPALDAFRATLPGALLLGRVFSAWDVVAYALGIGAAALVHRRAARVGWVGTAWLPGRWLRLRKDRDR